MFKKILAAAAVVCVGTAAPALAQVESHQNPSLNGYVGFATDFQHAQPTAFRTAAGASPVQTAGSDNPSVESFTPNAVSQPPTRFRTAPKVVENPDFGWIDQADVGA